MYAYAAYAPLAYPRPRSPWRRRAIKAAVWCGLVLFAVFALSRTAYGGGSGGYEVVRVGVGETVWGIATARYPGTDTRSKVDEIERLNGLEQGLVQPGQTLKVPAG